MTESNDTSKTEALANRGLREDIITKPDVTSLFQSYDLYEQGMVIIDRNTARQHVRNVINECKKRQNYGKYDTLFVSYIIAVKYNYYNY